MVVTISFRLFESAASILFKALALSFMTIATSVAAPAQDASSVTALGAEEESVPRPPVIRAAYEIGAYRITDLIAEQRRLVDSQREYTEALAEQYRALADIQAATGTPIAP